MTIAAALDVGDVVSIRPGTPNLHGWSHPDPDERRYEGIVTGLMWAGLPYVWEGPTYGAQSDMQRFVYLWVDDEQLPQPLHFERLGRVSWSAEHGQPMRVFD
jgi:hypothetical protein